MKYEPEAKRMIGMVRKYTAPPDTDALVTALAACRDVFAPPEPGTEAERQWAQAMGDPESVPAYIKHRKEVFESVLRQALAALEQVAAWKEGGRRMAQEAIAAIRKCVGK